MEGRKMSVVGDGYRVALDDLEDEGSGEYSLATKEEESCSIEHVSENSNLRPLFSSELTEDATSSSSSSSSSGALFEFSDLMANLPIKRGLSRYYDGKSQSFTCLGRATSLEDLIKKDYHIPYNKRIIHRATRSYSPRATISKKGSRNYNFVISVYDEYKSGHFLKQHDRCDNKSWIDGEGLAKIHRNFCKLTAKKDIRGD